MLRTLTLLAAAAALAGSLAHAFRGQPGELDGAVQPHEVQIVVSGADEVSAVRYESGADDATAAGKVIVRRVAHEGDAAGARTLRRDCRRRTEGDAGPHEDPLAPMLRS